MCLCMAHEREGDADGRVDRPDWVCTVPRDVRAGEERGRPKLSAGQRSGRHPHVRVPHVAACAGAAIPDRDGQLRRHGS